MKKILGRLLVFFAGIPAIFSVVWFLPGMHHLALNAVIVVAACIGGYEILALDGKKHKAGEITEALFLGGLAPAVAWFVISGFLSTYISCAIVASSLLVIMSREIFRKTDVLAGILPRLQRSFFILCYPGLLSAFMIIISRFEGASAFYLLFFSLCFGNDSLAWATGMTFGKRRNIIPVSPNKSVAGFIGGLAASVLISLAARLLWPPVFAGPLWAWLCLGFFTGIAVIMGDLAESAIKRSVGAKDSGSIIPGRGGLLDSIDSLLFAAPVFFFATSLIQKLS